MSDNKIKSLIVDDEPHAVELLDILLQENCPIVQNLGKANSVNEAYEKINLLRPDVVFLDIKLRHRTAFDLLNRFENSFFRLCLPQLMIIMPSRHLNTPPCTT